MTRSRMLAATAALLAVATALAGSPRPPGWRPARAEAGPPAEESVGDAKKGKAVYESNCVPCHKKDGTGGKKIVPTGNPSRNFTTPEFWRGHTDAQLVKAVEAGFPKSGMVAWKGVLRPQQIRDVTAYLRAQFQPKATK